MARSLGSLKLTPVAEVTASSALTVSSRQGTGPIPSGDGGALGSLSVSSDPFENGVVTVGGVGTAFEATSRYDKREANGTAVEVTGRVEVKFWGGFHGTPLIMSRHEISYYELSAPFT